MAEGKFRASRPRVHADRAIATQNAPIDPCHHPAVCLSFDNPRNLSRRDRSNSIYRRVDGPVKNSLLNKPRDAGRLRNLDATTQYREHSPTRRSRSPQIIANREENRLLVKDSIEIANVSRRRTRKGHRDGKRSSTKRRVGSS